ncbi:hypothetical protein K1T71_015270 [Dendrolimus kikuchii]|nr:hypothetical protein K1T71_015270 [Dendrolimus kikuchii]
MGDKYKELEEIQPGLMENARMNEKKVKDLIQRNIYFEKCNSSIEERIGWLEQKELSLNLELVNVKKVENENIMKVVEKVAYELKLNATDIEYAWRVQGENSNSKPIIIKMRSRDARSQWLKSRKNQITNHTIYNNNDYTHIYINEHLTYHMRQLFWNTKQKLKEEYKFIWIRDGKILIKKNENEKKIYNVRTEKNISKYLLKNTEEAE